MPKVSVIVPNYNHSLFLVNRIDSILNQTYQNFELILMDDASSDNSLDILLNYANHPKVKLLINEQNSGNTFIQWNKGVALARGEFIWIAESDDFAHPEFLETLMEIIEQDENIGLVYCNSAYMDDEGHIFGSQANDLAKLDKLQWKSDFVEDGKFLLTSYMIVTNIIPNASAVVFRKACFLLVGGARTDMLLCGDWIMWISFMMQYDIGFVEKQLNLYRFHDSTVRKRMYHTMQFIFEYITGLKYVDEIIGIPAVAKKKAFTTYGYKFFKMCINYCRKPDLKRYFTIICIVSEVFGRLHATILGLGGLLAMMISSIKLPFLTKRLNNSSSIST